MEVVGVACCCKLVQLHSECVLDFYLCKLDLERLWSSYSWWIMIMEKSVFVSPTLWKWRRDKNKGWSQKGKWELYCLAAWCLLTSGTLCILIHADGIAGDRESCLRKMLVAMKTISGLSILQNKSFPGFLVKVQKTSRQVGIALCLFLAAFHYHPFLYFH